MSGQGQAWIDDLTANNADMAATSAAKESIYVWPRHKIVRFEV